MDHRLLRLRVRDIEALVAISRLGSLRRAAKEIGLSQPALGNTLSEIELALGAPIYIRSRGGLSPTPFGYSVIVAAQALLAEFENFKSAVRRTRSPPLRLGCTPFLAQVFLPRWIKRLPEGALEIIEGPVPILLEDLANGRLDAVLGFYPDADSGTDTFSHYLLRREPLRIVSGPGVSGVTSWKALEKVPWILPREPSVIRRVIEARFLAEGLVPPAPRIVSSNMATNLRLVRAGIGCAAIADSYLQEGGNASGIRVMKLRQSLDIAVSLVVRSGSEAHPRIQGAIEALKKAEIARR